jgi:hypothetical protein
MPASGPLAADHARLTLHLEISDHSSLGMLNPIIQSRWCWLSDRNGHIVARFGLAQLLALLGLLAIEQIFKVAHGMTFSPSDDAFSVRQLSPRSAVVGRCLVNVAMH